ncbi:hypothetical protein HMPREF9972_02999 [Staphylococcus epidermidis NIH04008]|uniref:hypothetical protein n=1 Tax=Staphylococcus epidermidis TaxID=1282 RepID=UPI00026BF19D|nr:hypothetical protein HMPREF9972_02999 [Staphylococcus epidermidis NIH04008]EUR97062.1 hypothetical protein O237_01935 [Staphylococcus epidermidis M0026]PIH43743.1 hypothetical protein CTJ01_09155 [Staphylococcus epidermidis]
MKFTIPKQFNDYTLREIFQYLKLPKKDLHQLNMSKEILINKHTKISYEEIYDDRFFHSYFL